MEWTEESANESDRCEAVGQIGLAVIYKKSSPPVIN